MTDNLSFIDVICFVMLLIIFFMVVQKIKHNNIEKHLYQAWR